MFTKETATAIASNFVRELKRKGFQPTKAVLFGSYAKGNAHELSDIDLAIWDNKFTGCLPVDVESILDIKIKFDPLLEVHTFHSSATEETVPIIREILMTGIPVDSE
jgi:predicted nucleotidyltransferase